MHPHILTHMNLSWEDDQPTIFSEDSVAGVKRVCAALADSPGRLAEFQAELEHFRSLEQTLLKAFKALMTDEGWSLDSPNDIAYRRHHILQQMDELAISLIHHIRRSDPSLRPLSQTTTPMQILLVFLMVAMILGMVLLLSLRR